jgi:DNA-binding NtrC family response regulator
MSLPAIKLSPLPVLLIEDEPAVMAYVQAALERSGYPVVCCESGVEALRLLESGSFMGVVSDMRTPGGVDGGQVHAWIARHRPDLAGRVVFITGDIANEETVATLRETGAPCVEKPFRVQQFIEVVAKTLGKV